MIPSSDLFAKRVPWWQENYLCRQKPSTQRTMKYHVRKYLLPKWSRHPVDCITAERVNEWIGDLSHLSPMSQKHIVATLCLILGRQFGRKKITYMSVKEEQEEAVCYTPEEMSSIISQAQGMWKALFATAAETGARAGELHGLEVADIDFVRNIIHVRRSVWEGQKQSTKSRNANRAIEKVWCSQQGTENRCATTTCFAGVCIQFCRRYPSVRVECTGSGTAGFHS